MNPNWERGTAKGPDEALDYCDWCGQKGPARLLARTCEGDLCPGCLRRYEDRDLVVAGITACD